MRPALTALDRCDRCRAQAVAVTQHGAGELLLCAHHYAEHRVVLAPSLILYQPDEDKVPA